MSRWICSYCRSVTAKGPRVDECPNCGGPLRRATREEATRFDQEGEAADER